MEVHDIDVEHAIHDVMDIICKYLEVEDLFSIAKVCKSWRYAALREAIGRIHLQPLSYKFNDLNSVLDICPNASLTSLLIYDSRLEKSLSLPVDSRNWQRSNGLEEELLEDFQVKLPHKNGKVIVIKVDEYLTTESMEFRDTSDQRKLELTNDHCDILGYFLPTIGQRIRVDVASLRVYDDYRFANDLDLLQAADQAAEHLAKGLGFYDYKCSKSIIIIIALIGRNRALDAGEIVRELRNRAQNDEDIKWIAIYGEKLVAADCLNESQGSNDQNFVTLRISGPSVESWTTSLHYLSQRKKIERKLQELKKMVVPRRYCTGLVYSPRCNLMGCSHAEHPTGDPQEMMRYVKRFFPGIPFLGQFSNFGFWNSVAKIPDRMDHKNHALRKGCGRFLRSYATIMIISYD